MSRVRELRLALGEGALLTVGEAAEILPMAARDARAWLRAERLIRDLAGRQVVVWREVLARLEAQGDPSRREARPAPRAAPLRRATLKPIS